MAHNDLEFGDGRLDETDDDDPRDPDDLADDLDELAPDYLTADDTLPLDLTPVDLDPDTGKPPPDYAGDPQAALNDAAQVATSWLASDEGFMGDGDPDQDPHPMAGPTADDLDPDTDDTQDQPQPTTTTTAIVPVKLIDAALADPDRDPDAPIYDRLPNEGVKAYAAFCEYRDMPAYERSLTKVAQRLTVKRELITRWSGQWGWVKRANANDAAIEARKRQALDKEIKEMAERHAGIAALVVAKVFERLQTLDPAKIGAHALTQMLDVGVKVERLSRGVPTENVANEISGPHGSAIEIRPDYSYFDAIAGLAPRPMGDSQPSGEDESPGDGEAMG